MAGRRRRGIEEAKTSGTAGCSPSSPGGPGGGGDLEDRRDLRPKAAPPPEEFPSFTREQLDVYGIHELQVLEDLLRRQDGEARRAHPRGRLREDQDQDRLAPRALERPRPSELDLELSWVIDCLDLVELPDEVI